MHESRNPPLILVTYRDNILNNGVFPQVISCQNRALEGVATRLARDHRANAIRLTPEGIGAYLISGVIVETNRVRQPQVDEKVDEIRLIGESRTDLRVLARYLGLQEIHHGAFSNYRRP